MDNPDLLAYLLGLPVLAGLTPFGTALTFGLLLRLGFVADPVLLQTPFLAFAETEFLVVVGCLFIVERGADKIPVLDHLADGLNYLVKPLAGAALALASVGALGGDGMLPLLAVASALWGGALAGAVHTLKAANRLVVSHALFGFLNPIVSLAEDVAVVLGTMIMIFAPWFGVVLLFLTFGLVAYAGSKVVRGLVVIGRRMRGLLRVT